MYERERVREMNARDAHEHMTYHIMKHTCMMRCHDENIVLRGNAFGGGKQKKRKKQGNATKTKRDMGNPSFSMQRLRGDSCQRCSRSTSSSCPLHHVLPVTERACLSRGNTPCGAECFQLRTTHVRLVQPFRSSSFLEGCLRFCPP